MADNGSHVPIVYRFPSSEIFEAVERGEMAIGGCIVHPTNPVGACPACEHRW
jgi:hypothetical protein